MMNDQQKLLILLGIVVIISMTIIIYKRNKGSSFLYGFSLSVLAYSLSSLFFFWFAVLRRMNVLNIPYVFDSELGFWLIIIPSIVAIPWIPVGITAGIKSWKKCIIAGFKFFKISFIVVTILLSVLFWFLPYN
jgi:hypothetical protein